MKFKKTGPERPWVDIERTEMNVWREDCEQKAKCAEDKEIAHDGRGVDAVVRLREG